MFSKKGVSEVIIIVLLLVIFVVSSLVLYNFLIGKQNSLVSDIEKKTSTGRYELEDLRFVDLNSSVLISKYSGEFSNVLELYKSGEKCKIFANFQKGNLVYVFSDCSVLINKSYSLDLVTNSGVFDRTLTVYRGMDKILNIVYRVGTKNCQLGEIKLFGIDSYLGNVNNSHVELPNQNIFQNSACISSEFFNLGNQCLGNYKRLFYLANVSNSHIYNDNSSPYPGLNSNYYNWNDVCLSSETGTIDVRINSSMPDLGYYCLLGGSFNDSLGGMVGSCDYYDDKIWISVL